MPADVEIKIEKVALVPNGFLSADFDLAHCSCPAIEKRSGLGEKPAVWSHSGIDQTNGHWRGGAQPSVDGALLGQSRAPRTPRRSTSKARCPTSVVRSVRCQAPVCSSIIGNSIAARSARVRAPKSFETNETAANRPAKGIFMSEIGRASCRERVCT